MKVRLGSLVGIMSVIFCVFVSLSHAIDKNAIVGIWFFDEGGGEVAKDSSGNGHDGELLGDLEWVEGKFNGAISFPGVNGSFVSVPHEDSLNLTKWTITVWVKTAISDVWHTLVEKENPSDAESKSNYHLQIRDTGVVDCGYQCPDWQESWGMSNVQDGKWHHLAGTYDGNLLRVYVDGNLENEETYGTTPITNNHVLGLGACSDGQYGASAVIDEIGLFDAAFSAEEIKAIMTSGLIVASAVFPADKLTTAWGQIKVSD